MNGVPTSEGRGLTHAVIPQRLAVLAAEVRLVRCLPDTDGEPSMLLWSPGRHLVDPSGEPVRNIASVNRCQAQQSEAFKQNRALELFRDTMEALEM